MAKILLEMKSITKTFPGVKALDNVNLKVEEGETYEGDIIYNGEVCKFAKIKDSEEKEIVIIHQELALIPYMTIGENMFLGNERRKKATIDWSETYGQADEYMRKVGLKESSRTLIKDIGVGKQQLVEIAKALAKNAKLLILDEPTASLNESDSQALLDLMLEFKKQGMTSIMISSELPEVLGMCDRIYVMNEGKMVGELDAEEAKQGNRMLLCILTGGNINLSVGSVVCFVGAVGAVVMENYKMNMGVVVVAMLVIGTLIGAWQGYWIAFVPDFFGMEGSNLTCMKFYL